MWIVILHDTAGILGEKTLRVKPKKDYALHRRLEVATADIQALTRTPRSTQSMKRFMRTSIATPTAAMTTPVYPTS